MKKIISFSLWGSNTKYTEGAVKNAEDVQVFYPGWIARFYHDTTVPQDILERIAATGAEMKPMGETTDVLGMYWRFHPICDNPEVERFIVRDTDSRFTQREVKMVNEWVESGKDFHIIRDNRSHNISMLGGTWGAKGGIMPDFMTRLSIWFAKLTPTNNDRGLFFGTDQMFLHWYVWPVAVKNHCAHVLANTPELKITGNEIEVPAPEDGHFVGMPA